MTALLRDASVATLREQSLTAECLSWEAHLAGLLHLAIWWEREADSLWQRSEDVARAEVSS